MINRKKVNPHVYRFSDHENVLEILSNRPRRYVTRFNNFFSQIEYNPRLNIESFFAKINNDRPGETLIRILDLYKNLPIKNGRFVDSCLRIINSNAISEFEKLDKDSQYRVWDLNYYDAPESDAQSCADRAYLRLLNMTGMPLPTSIEHVESASNYLEFVRAHHAERSLSGVTNQRQIDLSTPSVEFYDKIYVTLRDQKYVPKDSDATHNSVDNIGAALFSLHPYADKIVLMLRALYGEDKIFALYQHFNESAQFLCADDLVNLLEEWDKLSDYPAEWIKHMKNLEH